MVGWMRHPSLNQGSRYAHHALRARVHAGFQSDFHDGSLRSMAATWHIEHNSAHACTHDESCAGFVAAFRNRKPGSTILIKKRSVAVLCFRHHTCSRLAALLLPDKWGS